MQKTDSPLFQDANLVKNTKLLQQEEKLVELHNGCICCTLREDLVKALSGLAAEGKYDAIVVESTGVSDPQEVAETFTYEIDPLQAAEDLAVVEKPGGEGTSNEAAVEAVVHRALLTSGATALNDVARLDTCVTVVDCGAFRANLGSSLDIHEKFTDAEEEDQRSVAPLLMQQIEFSDVVVLNKTDLVSEAEAAEVEASIRALNREAQVLRSTRGDVPLQEVLRTGRFSIEKAANAPGWLQTMRGEPTVPETEEYNIASFVYRARTPFHPTRFSDFLSKYFMLNMNSYGDGDGDGEEADEAGAGPEEGEEARLATIEGREQVCAERTAAMKAAFGTVLRSKGFVWLAGRDEVHGEWSQAGAMGELSCGGPWACMLPADELPEAGTEDHALLLADFEGPVLQDRRQELVFIGQKVDEAALTAALDACLVTPAEARAGGRAPGPGEDEHAWKLGDWSFLEDDVPAFPPLAELLQGHDHDGDHDHHGHHHH